MCYCSNMTGNISHPSKVMLKVILNRLKPQAEKIIAEEQAGFREGRSTMDPVLSHHTSQERQPAAVPELPNNKPHQSPKQTHAEDHTKQIEATSGEDYRRRSM